MVMPVSALVKQYMSFGSFSQGPHAPLPSPARIKFPAPPSRRSVSLLAAKQAHARVIEGRGHGLPQDGGEGSLQGRPGEDQAEHLVDLK